ncbi:MAG: FAD-dependent oxidoreductase [Planctomycetota bacterium]
MAERIEIDSLVVGGGAAGLFLLRALRAAGHGALLVERSALGTGQTTSSQGILHAGVKYALGGVAGDDAQEASEAAAMWSGMLEGRGMADLRGLRVLAREEYLWRTAGLKGAAGMLGARLALRTRPEAIEASRRPAWLDGVAGDVLTLPETVIDPRDLLARLAAAEPGRIALGEVRSLAGGPDGWAVGVRAGAHAVQVLARRVFLCAGEGNEALLAMAGLAGAEPMQRRPLRQAMVRGALPMVFGHCIDGAKTRITVTSDTSPEGTVWHVGCEIAERGPELAEDAFLDRARTEIAACLPAVDLRGVEWSSYLVQRAEPRTTGGRRPSSVHVRAHGSLVAVWPVKLVMAPRAAVAAMEHAGSATGLGAVWPAGRDAPPLAARPWETAAWRRLP